MRLPARAGRSRPPASASAAEGATSSSRSPGGQIAARQGYRLRLGGPPRARAPASPGRGPPLRRIGVISDNHGYLDPAVLEIFAGVVHIIHAGDIVDPEILTALETVAPVTAVGGNMDAGDLAARLPRAVAGEVAGVRFVVGHKRKRLLKDLAAGKIAGVTGRCAPRPRGLRPRPRAGGRLGRGHALPGPGQRQRTARRRRRAHRGHRRGQARRPRGHLRPARAPRRERGEGAAQDVTRTRTEQHRGPRSALTSGLGCGGPVTSDE